MKVAFKKWCSDQYQRRRTGRINLVKLIDLTFGKDYCMLCWIDYSIGRLGDENGLNLRR